VPLRTLLSLGLEEGSRRRLRALFSRLPLSQSLFGGAVVVAGRELLLRPSEEGAVAAGVPLSESLPVATPLLAALINFQQALEELGACSHKERPLVLSEPPVAAVGTCLHKRAAEVLRERGLGHCPGPQAVLCGDGVCRDTYVDCFRARCVGPQAEALGCAGLYVRELPATIPSSSHAVGGAPPAVT
jgi:hypothetical protein